MWHSGCMQGAVPARALVAACISRSAPLPCCWLQSHQVHQASCCAGIGIIAHALGSLHPDMALFQAGAVILSPGLMCWKLTARPAASQSIAPFSAGISSIAYVLDSFVAGAITWMAAVSFKAAASAETRQQLPHVFQVLPICHAKWPSTSCVLLQLPAARQAGCCTKGPHMLHYSNCPTCRGCIHRLQCCCIMHAAVLACSATPDAGQAGYQCLKPGLLSAHTAAYVCQGRLCLAPARQFWLSLTWPASDLGVMCCVAAGNHAGGCPVHSGHHSHADAGGCPGAGGEAKTGPLPVRVEWVECMSACFGTCGVASTREAQSDA